MEIENSDFTLEFNKHKIELEQLFISYFNYSSKVEKENVIDEIF